MNGCPGVNNFSWPRRRRRLMMGPGDSPGWAMHTPSWASDRPTASRCSVVGFVTPPHRAAAGGPPEAEDGRDRPGRALGGSTLGRDHPLEWDTATGTAAPPVGFQSLGTRDAQRRETSRRTTQPSGLTTRTGSRRTHPEGTLGRGYPQGCDAATWAAASPVGFQPLGTQRSAPAGDVGANYTTTGLDGPPETWSCGASDHDGSANAASHVEIHTAGAHVPAGMHETYISRRSPARTMIPATGHETPARNGAPYHRQATTRTAYPTGVPLNETSCGCRASHS